MTLSSELFLHNLDLSYRSSISHQFARYALSLKYSMLPKEAVHQAKRSLLDALGCAIGSYNAPGRPMCEAWLRQLGGPEEATTFGSGLRTSAANASLVNGFLICYLGFNDVGGGGHNSTAVASILAIAEREKATGKDLLTSMVTSYELGARFSVLVDQLKPTTRRTAGTDDWAGPAFDQTKAPVTIKITRTAANNTRFVM